MLLNVKLAWGIMVMGISIMLIIVGVMYLRRDLCLYLSPISQRTLQFCSWNAGDHHRLFCPDQQFKTKK
jgi:hypothetical protein